MKDPLQQVIQKTQRYWYVDGLTEIAAGGVITLLGLFYLTLGLVDRESPLGEAVVIGQMVVILIGYLAASRAVRYFKERLTYPRTGFVQYPRTRGKQRWVSGVLTAMTAAGVALVVTQMARRLDEAWLPFLMSGIIALAFLYMGGRLGLTRFYVLAVYTLALGGAMTALRLPEPFSYTVLFCGMGVSWIASGALTLARYLRETQPLEEAE